MLLTGCTDRTDKAAAAATPGDAGAQADAIALADVTPGTVDAKIEARADAGSCESGDPALPWLPPITARETTVIAAQVYASHPVLAGGRLLWTAEKGAEALGRFVGPVSIFSAPTEGGAPVRLYTGQRSINALMADASNLYWVDDAEGTLGRIVVMPLEAGAPTVLLERDATFKDLAVSATHLYATYVDSGWGGVLRVPIAGGAVEQLAPDPPGPTSTKADRTPSPWTLSSSTTPVRRELTGPQPSYPPRHSEEGVFRRPLAGGTRETIAIDLASRPFSTGYPVGSRTTLAMRADSLCANRDGSLICRNGGDLTLREVATGMYATAIAISDGYLYFTSVPHLTTEPISVIVARCPFELRRVPVAGGDVETIATRTHPVNGVTVEGSYVFWIGNDRLLRTALQ